MYLQGGYRTTGEPRGWVTDLQPTREWLCVN